MKKYNFTNLKVVLHFEASANFTSNPFDSTLAALYAEELQKEGKYEEYEHKQLELPFLKMTDGIYHASCPIVEQEQLFMESLGFMSTFDIERQNKWGLPREKPDPKRNEFKNYTVDIERYFYESVAFYLCGDKDKITNLLKNLKYFGKKGSLGFGKISKIEIHETESDQSLLNNKGEANRPLPCQHFSNVKNPKKALKRPIYPYYKKYGHVECFI